MVKSLVQLTRLSVEDCESLEEIIVTEASDEGETTSTMLFPKLESVWLWNLPKLKQFCTGCLIECPLLKSLVIGACSGLETFISDCGSTKVTVRNEAGEVRLKEKCHSAIQPLFNEKVAFPSLTRISIYGMHNLEKIWHDQLNAGCFSELRSLSIKSCRKLVNIFPSISLRTFQRLEKLDIWDCDLLEAIWNNNRQGILSFQNLRSVMVWGCEDLKNIFPFSIARNLPQLEKLEIRRCGAEAIVAKLEDDETAPRFEFPQLTSLKLNSLGKLRHFYPEKHTWECPKLKSLAVSGCGNVKLFGSKFLNFQEIQVEAQHDNPIQVEAQHDDPIQQPLFFVEKVISNLEELSLGGQDTSNTSILWHCQLSADFYSILKVLKLQNFKRKSDRIPFGFVQRLRNLETLTVISSSFKRLFLNEGIVEEEHKWKLAQFRNLILESVDDMRDLWEQDHQLAPLIHNLKTLQVKSCHSLVNLAPSSASFQNLLTLDVKSCNGLSSLITSSTAKSLAQLVNLTIGYCDMITEVVGKQGDETEDEIVFSRMEYLELENLKSLTSFCPGNDTFNFPSLKEVSVQGCPKMKIFAPGLLSTPKLLGVRGPQYKKWWRGSLNATIQQLYTEMLGFDGVGALKLSDFPHLRQIWHGRLPFNFSYLHELIVDECAFVSNAIPSNLLKLMNNLGRMTVSKCDSLEGVFDLIGLNAAEGHLKLLSNLWQLCLIDLPRLMHLWNMDPQRILDLKNLQFLEIKNCGSLRYIFTPSMAFGLVQLRKIEIRKCDMMEVIITKEGEDEATMDEIIFPSLRVIVLESLPKLTSICSGTAILEIPSLEKISIDNCPNMKAFVSSFLKEQEPNLASEGKTHRLDRGDHDISTAPLINHKVGFSNLKNLRVGWNDIMEVIRHDQFPKECFCKLEVLELVHFPSDYVDFPFHFIRRFTNLKNLVLSDAAFLEVVLHEETDGEEKHMGIVVQLEQLKLSKLPKLVHLSKEDPQSFQIFQKLETLKVLECGVVKILMPSATSFQCLQILEVSNCNRLINLMTSSIAKQLVELKSMSITECEMIVEIVASEENEAESEVVFHKLEHMRLHSLPSLTSFYSRNCAFMFPSLEEVLVIECPKMKYFAPGVISTPELERVLLTEEDEEEGYWEGNIDATIRKIFVDMADGSAQSKLPSSSKQLTCETTDDNEPKIVSERLASEDLPVTANPHSSKDLPLMVETVLKTKEHAIQGASIEPEIAQLTSSSQDSHATSKEKEDPAEGQNSSTPVDLESHISRQVQKHPQAADKQINFPALRGQDSWTTSNDQEDASQDLNFSTLVSAETYISPQVQMDVPELDKDQIMHASSIENRSNLVPTSPATSVQQAPALSCTSPTKTQCSQELIAFSASRQMQDISTSPISDRSSPSRTDFETLIIRMERMLHPSSTSSSQPSSSSNSRYQSHDSIGVSFETYRHSMARMKKILMKSPTEVASSADRFLLLSALMNLRNCHLLNFQQLEIVQVYIENFDSLVTINPSYEQQIDSTSALKFAMEDNKNRISELMNRYEDLSSKSSTLSVNKQALKRKLQEIEIEEARICNDMDDLRAQLVTRKEKLETQLKVFPEAERQQREAVERASNVNDNWARIRSLFA